MTISTLRLELFIGGYFFIIFVSYPLISKYYSHDDIIYSLPKIKEYLTLIIPNIIILSYTIGTLANGIGFLITDYFFSRRFKKIFFGKEYKKENYKYNYKKIKSAVFSNSIGYATSRLDFHHNNIRLIRSIIFDILIFLFIILYIFFNEHIIYVSKYYIGFCIFILIGLFLQLNNSSKTYYEDMKKAYDMITEGQIKKRKTKENYYWRKKNESNF